MASDSSYGGVDHPAEVILGDISARLGVQVINDWSGEDDYLFRGPHGRLERLKYSEIA